MTERTIPQERLLALASERMNAKALGVEALGGGFYGRVFKVLLDGAPGAVVLKVYLFPEIARRERVQLQTPREVSALEMPRVYFVDDATDERPYDVLGMSFIAGRNAGEPASIDEPARSVIAREIVNGLLAFHRTVNPRGFGRLDDAGFAPDWRRYYYPIAMRTFDNACRLYDDQRLPSDVMRVAERAVERYDGIFCLPGNLTANLRRRI